MTNAVIIGSTIGFSLWLVNILSMEGIIVRQDDEGNYVITPENILEYLKLPFDQNKRYIAWGTLPKIPIGERIKCMSLNWIILTCLGAGVGFFIQIYN